MEYPLTLTLIQKVYETKWTKMVIHPDTALLMDGIIVKINYSPFSMDPLEPPPGVNRTPL